MEDKKLETGDIVVLGSGSPPMTVGRLSDDKQQADCFWFIDSQVKSSWLPIKALKLKQSKDAYRASAKES